MKAQAQAIEIVGKGHVKATGAVCYGARSASTPNRVYLLIWDGAAHSWTCECPRFAYRRSCKHVDALNARLAAEIAATLRTRKEQAITERRETSMRRQPAAFSLLK